MKIMRIVPIVLVCLALAGLPAAAQRPDPRRAVQQGQAMPLAQVLQRTMPAFPGRLLKVDLENDGGGRLVYRLRILRENGEVIIVTADARTAAVLGVQGNR